MTTKNKTTRSVAQSIRLRPVHRSWNDVKFSHGIAPKKVHPSKFICQKQCPGWDLYWRDIPSRKAMDIRVEGYFNKYDINIDESSYSQAFNRVEDMFLRHYGCLNVISVDEAFKRLPSSTSAGLPFEQGVKKGDVANQLKILAKLQWKRVSQGKDVLFAPCRAGARRQLRLVGENKPRLIWAYPGYVNILETQFTAMFMENPAPFLGWSLNFLDNGSTVERLSSSLTHSVAHLDFTSFDSTVCSRLIRDAFRIIGSLFELDVIQYNMLRDLEEYFIHTPLVYYNTVVTKHRGIPSGSAFTQLIGSICNMIACHYCSFKGGSTYCIQETSKWLGDDSLLFFDDGMAVEEFKDSFLAYFKDLGLSVSHDKTGYVVNNEFSFKKDASFKVLGREIVSDGRRYKLDRARISAQVVWPEEEDRSKYDTASRLMGLVWAYGFTRAYYGMFLSLYRRLEIKDTRKIIPRQSIIRFASIFLSKDVNLTKFPSFEDIQTRYFGEIDRYIKVCGGKSCRWKAFHLLHNVEIT